MQGISEMEESAFMEPASGVGIAPLQHINRKNESCRNRQDSKRRNEVINRTRPRSGES